MSDAKLTEATELMIRVGKLHRGMVEQLTRSIGMHRTQHRILMHLAREGALPSQKELAERLNITPAAVTVALKKIEQDGYIERTLGQDTRYNELKITEKGRSLVTLTRELFRTADTAMFEGFTAEELDTYVAYLQRMQANIQRRTEKEGT